MKHAQCRSDCQEEELKTDVPRGTSPGFMLTHATTSWQAGLAPIAGEDKSGPVKGRQVVLRVERLAFDQLQPADLPSPDAPCCISQNCASRSRIIPPSQTQCQLRRPLSGRPLVAADEKPIGLSPQRLFRQTYLIGKRPVSPVLAVLIAGRCWDGVLKFANM